MKKTKFYEPIENGKEPDLIKEYYSLYSQNTE